MSCECLEEIHVGDIGTQFIVTIKEVDSHGKCVVVDVSTASDMKIVFDKPDGTGIEVTATLLNDGKDGKIQWTTSLSTDLDQEGEWKMQGKVSIGLGTWRSNIDSFRVYPNIEVP